MTENTEKLIEPIDNKVDNNQDKTVETTSVAALNADLLASSKELVQNVIDAQNSDEFKDFLALFNLNQNKKNALRVVKLSELLDKVEDQAIERFNKKPDQMSNKDLLDFMQVLENSIERSQKQTSELKETPAIQVNQQNNINISTLPETSRESRERIIHAVTLLLDQMNSQNNVVDIDDDNNQIEEISE